MGKTGFFFASLHKEMGSGPPSKPRSRKTGPERWPGNPLRPPSNLPGNNFGLHKQPPRGPRLVGGRTFRKKTGFPGNFYSIRAKGFAKVFCSPGLNYENLKLSFLKEYIFPLISSDISQWSVIIIQWDSPCQCQF